jgi:hypothetical protein
VILNMGTANRSLPVGKPKPMSKCNAVKNRSNDCFFLFSEPAVTSMFAGMRGFFRFAAGQGAMDFAGCRIAKRWSVAGCPAQSASVISDADENSCPYLGGLKPKHNE